MASDTDSVLKTVDEMKQEIVDALISVVQVPSVNPKYPGVNADEVLGGESDANEIIAGWYREDRSRRRRVG